VPILVNGQRTRLVGRVSMDKITVDVTDIPLAQVGSPVELWGAQLAVDEVANAAGTIGYELLTAVAQRVPRRPV
jgi:alanine racemase